MTTHALLELRRILRSGRGVTASEYALLAVGLIGIVAICAQLIATAFGPMIVAVAGAINAR